MAGKVFNNFINLFDQSSPSVLIWGPSFARWFLKVMLGLVGSKQVIISGEKFLPADLPLEWIEILFGLKEFSNGRGLYMTPVVGDKITPGKKIKLSTLLLDGTLQALSFDFAGMEFTLSMTENGRGFNWIDPHKAPLHPPRKLNLDQREDRIVIFWE